MASEKYRNRQKNVVKIPHRERLLNKSFIRDGSFKLQIYTWTSSRERRYSLVHWDRII